MWRIATACLVLCGWVPSSCQWLPSVLPPTTTTTTIAPDHPYGGEAMAYWKEPGHCDVADELHCWDFPTLEELVQRYFQSEDWDLALRIAYCESSAEPQNDITHPTTLALSKSDAVGWFQHLPMYWPDRSHWAGFTGYDIHDPVANVGVAAWLLYSTPQGTGHWWPSRSCWEVAS